MLQRLIHFFWGEFTDEDIKKFGILSITFFFIIGNYWLIRSLKDALFASLVGFSWVPYAKILSLVVNIFVVMGYGKLVDVLKKDRLFYLLCGFYSLLFIFISIFTLYTNAMEIDQTSIFYSLTSWIPGKILGWITYVAIESSSILIALFWAFVASVMKVDSAKKGYGMIFFLGQTGQLLGAGMVANFAQKFGSPVLLALSGFLILCVPLMIMIYMRVIPQEEVAPEVITDKAKPKTGFMGGLKLLLTKPYVMGIFVVATSYEVIGTVLDFQMKLIASNQFSRDAFAAFNAKFGMSVGVLSLTFALLGTSFFMRKFGLKFCLISYPTMIGVLVGSIFVLRTFGITDYTYMWIIFAAMIAIKGLNYTLNNPTKEVMYIPTSKDVKFKAKSWIDVFGNRTTKGIGSTITGVFRTSLPDLLFYGTLISLGVVGFWIFIAALLGKAFGKLQEEGTIIE
ncbi:hypothetical protein GF322_02570 [Candidatus Dependentiae bacterium]|nr:hypothetical protein [Candidatus Dependentiae bacterium]